MLKKIVPIMVMALVMISFDSCKNKATSPSVDNVEAAPEREQLPDSVHPAVQKGEEFPQVEAKASLDEVFKQLNHNFSSFQYPMDSGDGVQISGIEAKNGKVTYYYTLTKSLPAEAYTPDVLQKLKDQMVDILKKQCQDQQSDEYKLVQLMKTHNFPLEYIHRDPKGNTLFTITVTPTDL